MRLPQEIFDRIFLHCNEKDLSNWYLYIDCLHKDIYYTKYGDINLAAWYGSLIAVKKLMKSNSKTDKEMALITACLMGRLNIVKFLIERGVEPCEECVELSENEEIKEYINLKIQNL